MAGYFQVAIYQPKTLDNVGTLWRSAYSYGAIGICDIGSKTYRKAGDTCKTYKQVPYTSYDDFEDFLNHRPMSATLVGVELDSRAEPLESYKHPRQAIYLLGSENHGLPQDVIDRCDEVIKISSPTDWSLNVSVAGSIVFYDRYLKEQ